MDFFLSWHTHTHTPCPNICINEYEMLKTSSTKLVNSFSACAMNCFSSFHTVIMAHMHMNERNEFLLYGQTMCCFCRHANDRRREEKKKIQYSNTLSILYRSINKTYLINAMASRRRKYAKVIVLTQKYKYC